MVGVALLFFATASPIQPPPLTLDERVIAQTAIERVYWQHRIWPNPTPKPPLEAVMPAVAIRAKVEGYLRKSAALDVSAADATAEADRIVRDTHDAGMIQELFTALGDDPILIAETL